MVRNSTKNLFAEPKRAALPFTNVISHAIRTRDFISIPESTSRYILTYTVKVFF